MDPSTAKVEPGEPEIQSDPQLQRVPEKAGLCEMLSQESKQASKQNPFVGARGAGEYC